MSENGPAIRRFADGEQMCGAAAEALVDWAVEAVKSRGRFTAALSGGSTPKRLYELLAEPPFRERVEWEKVELFWGDERAVPPDHREANFRVAHEALLAKLELPARQIHRMRTEEEDRDTVARDYQNEIARVFGVSPAGAPPCFDLVLLGLGADGHTASLFPHTQALKETSRWVVACFVPQIGAERISLTPRIINRASHVLFLVAGEEKAQALAEVLEGTYDPERLPAQLIQPSAGRLVWFVDDAAAGCLESYGAGRLT